MMREQFDRDIQQLKKMFIDMGEKTQESIKTAVESLKEQNMEKARWAVELDDQIDKLEYEIENKCLLLISLQQPIAKDLRSLGTLLKIITDMERMGDYSVNIANVTLTIGDEKLIKPLVDIPKMADIIEKMLDRCMDSFMREDTEMAREVAEMDDEVDALYAAINSELLTIISQDVSVSRQAMNLMLVTRHLERVADHITNICERIIYMVTGERVEMN